MDSVGEADPTVSCRACALDEIVRVSATAETSLSAGTTRGPRTATAVAGRGAGANGTGLGWAADTPSRCPGVAGAMRLGQGRVTTSLAADEEAESEEEEEAIHRGTEVPELGTAVHGNGVAWCSPASLSRRKGTDCTRTASPGLGHRVSLTHRPRRVARSGGTLGLLMDPASRSTPAEGAGPAAAPPAGPLASPPAGPPVGPPAPR